MPSFASGCPITRKFKVSPERLPRFQFDKLGHVPSKRGLHGSAVPGPPDWARDIYEARALAMMFVRKHGCALQGSPCLQVVRNGLTVTFRPNRSPVLLTIDAPPGARVLSLEWNDGHAWRVAIETYHSGHWESQLKAMVHPRPWLERWRALASVGDFHGIITSTASRHFAIVIRNSC